MSQNTLTVALLTQIFPDSSSWSLLQGVLLEAKGMGAELAVLPEIPLNPWSPSSRRAAPEDAEEVDGPRQMAMSSAAAGAGVALLGGAIIRDPDSGARYNTALLYDASGFCRARYRKIHLPEEEGYWETSHYEPGHEPPALVEGLPLKLGLQICSDVNRTTGFQLLGAMGAEVVLVPRCTPQESYERWKLVLRGNAVTSGTYVVSVNRPAEGPQALVGGPSLVVGPTGDVLLESTDPVSKITLSRDVAEAARAEYPGYLRTYPELYARGWHDLERRDTE